MKRGLGTRSHGALAICWLSLGGLLVGAGTSLCATAALTDSEEFGCQKSADQIDRLVEERLQKLGLKPQPLIGDEEFVRRIYLDIAGRIPSIQETRDFLTSPAVDRRSQLVRRLIHSRGHQSHQYNYWADVLRVQDMDAGINRVFYVRWLKDALAENRPYDELAHELLVASGPSWQRGNGAVGYYLRDRGMPLDNIANSMQVFLGTRLACAQCHDHPNASWTRRQFFELAAYTHGLVTDNTASSIFAEIYQRERSTSDEELRAFSQYMRNTFHRDRVVGAGVGEISLPEDYQYSDGTAGDKVPAHPLFEPAETPVPEGAKDARHRLAQWITSPENPRFTKVIVNRLWKRAMGQGLFEPVDDLPDDEHLPHAELLGYLEELMVRSNYDMRAFLEVLFNTRTYQRHCVEAQPTDANRYAFQGRVVSRMTAEQVWDSLLTLTVADLDNRESDLFSSHIFYQLHPVFVGRKTMYDRFEETNDLNIEQYWAYLERELQEMKKDLAAQGIDYDTALASAGVRPWPAYKTHLLRASELRSPELPGHFLRIFGQSNREFIDGSSKSVNVVQLLAMFNGFIDQHVLHNADSVLLQEIMQNESRDERMDAAFLAVLSRHPTSAERVFFRDQLNFESPDWHQDLVWVLVNSQEFLFVR